MMTTKQLLDYLRITYGTISMTYPSQWEGAGCAKERNQQLVETRSEHRFWILSSGT